ncbi:MAG: UDP-N-acetylmuramate dehydrogenase, partial [bacterium]
MSISLKSLKHELVNVFGENRVLFHVPLARYCNWKVGGPADLFITVGSTDELLTALRMAQHYNQPTTLLGFGANALVSDKGIRGLVILNRAERIVFHPGKVVEVDSGTSLAVLAKRAAEQCVGGFEFLIGIPGTVGAAVLGNAGTRTQWISTVLDRVQLLGNDGQLYWKSTSELEFSYRSSRLKHTGEIVISVWLRGQASDQVSIENKMKELLLLRKNQPSGSNAGSVFRNPQGDYAGRLIEQC